VIYEPSEQSIKSRIRSAASDSSSVDLNASIIYAGILLMKPIVSVSNTTASSSFGDLVVVYSVVNSLAISHIDNQYFHSNHLLLRAYILLTIKNKQDNNPQNIENCSAANLLTLTKLC
jgi:hypothetical protein